MQAPEPLMVRPEFLNLTARTQSLSPLRALILLKPGNEPVHQRSDEHFRKESRNTDRLHIEREYASSLHLVR